jgi:hypothetical protein
MGQSLRTFCQQYNGLDAASAVVLEAIREVEMDLQWNVVWMERSTCTEKEGNSGFGSMLLKRWAWDRRIFHS